ncbi:hypothetical protein KI387_010977, partial [Taxus chinensis]
VGEIEVHTQLLSEDKLSFIGEIKGEGMTAMVGYGINDVLALVTADKGTTMGIAGSVLATEFADIAFIINDVRKIAIAVNLGWRSLKVIYTNVAFSLTMKVALVLLTFFWYSHLQMAVLADALA